MKRHSLNKRPASLGLTLHGVGFAVVVLVIGLYYCFVYGQLQSQAAADLQRIDHLAKFLQGSGPISALHHRLESEAEQLDLKGEKIRERLALPLNGEELTKSLHTIAAASGLEISQLTMQKATTVANHRQTDVHLQCTGSYASMCLFLEGISNSKWVADVTQLTVNANDKDHEHRLLAVLTVYYDHMPPNSNKT